MSLVDSGARREFETGAVRDIQEGKGRCDLLPLDVISKYYYGSVVSGGDVAASEYSVLERIRKFKTTGNEYYLYAALYQFTKSAFDSQETMILELAKHFEDGALKYGEYNWQKGIPLHCYIDSAIRHYLKYHRNDTDERHDRAFCWNIVCAIWTLLHMPELDDYTDEECRDEISKTVREKEN